jgi:hypothetical protein
MYPQLVLEVSKRLTHDLLLLFQRHHNDPVVANVDIYLLKQILDIVVQIFDNKEARSVFLPVFAPNMNSAIRPLVGAQMQAGDLTAFGEQDQKVNFLVALLDIHILAMRKCYEDGKVADDFLFLSFETLSGIVATNDNPIVVIKASICMKSYLLYLFPQVEGRKLNPLLYTALERMLQPKEQETMSFYLGNTMMILFQKVPYSSPRLPAISCITKCLKN